MQAEIEPITEREVTITMTESEARQLRLMLGAMSDDDARSIIVRHHGSAAFDLLNTGGESWMLRLYAVLDMMERQ